MPSSLEIEVSPTFMKNIALLKKSTAFKKNVVKLM